MKKDDIRARFLDTVEKYSMLDSDRILVGLSGGADSSVLLSLLIEECKKRGITLFCAHINHNIRGSEAKRDEDFCRTLCQTYGIKLFVLSANVPDIAKERGIGLEECAREVRYQFFSELMRENSIPTLAVAHNADDNLETVIFNLARGSGTRGISGIPPVRTTDGGRLVRPLICISKCEILKYAKDNKLDFVTDSTNTDTDYTRNHIRAVIVPALRKISPSPEESVVGLCESLRADDLYLDRCAENIINDNGIGNFAPLTLIRELDDAMFYRVISRMCRFSFERIHVRALQELVRGGIPHSRISLPSKMIAAVENEMLMFMSEKEYKKRFLTSEEFCMPLCEGENVIEAADIRITVTKISQKCENIYKNFIHTAIPFDKIKGQLYVRSRREGDKYTYGNMTRSVKKLLCDKKVPTDVRSKLPFICDDDGILWIPGFPAREICEKDENNKLYIYVEKNKK